jgi:hypothetical protein
MPARRHSDTGEVVFAGALQPLLHGFLDIGCDRQGSSLRVTRALRPASRRREMHAGALEPARTHSPESPITRSR